MKRLAPFLIFTLTVVVFSTSIQAKEETKGKAGARMEQNYGRIPLAFTENKGQVAEPVKFLLRGPRGTIFFTSTEVVFELIEKKPGPEEKKGISSEEKKAVSSPPAPAFAPGENKGGSLPPGSEKQSTYQGVVVRMQLINANPEVKLVGENELPGKVNILKGKDPKSWKTDIRRFGKITYLNLYPGLDFIYSGKENTLDWSIRTDSVEKLKACQIKYLGVDSLTLDHNGNLHINTDLGSILEKAPQVAVKGGSDILSTRFILRDKNTVGIALKAEEKAAGVSGSEVGDQTAVPEVNPERSPEPVEGRNRGEDSGLQGLKASE